MNRNPYAYGFGILCMLLFGAVLVVCLWDLFGAAMADALADTLLLCLMMWVMSGQSRKIASMEQAASWMFTRSARERMLLVQSRFHLRKFAQAVSMIEMAGTDKIVVTITIDTFVRDNLYGLVEQLDDYTPENFFEAFSANGKEDLNV